jgi:hypothetical protein
VIERAGEFEADDPFTGVDVLVDGYVRSRETAIS